MTHTFHIQKLIFALFLLLISAIWVNGQNDSIVEVIQNKEIVLKGQRIEFTFTLSQFSITNVYDYDEVLISGEFTSPSGKKTIVEAFYAKDYVINETSNNISLGSAGHFLLRYSPLEVGIWSVKFSLNTQTSKFTSRPYVFNCEEANVAGFIRFNHTQYLNNNDGDQYIPIGLNMAWQSNSVLGNYSNWLQKLAENGGNFIRLWMPQWGLGLEWKAGNGYQGLRRYNELNTANLDWLFSYAEEKGISIMLCIHHHGMVSTGVNPNWSDSPYNKVNGGPCVDTKDFFIDNIAKSHTKNKLRYIVARWGSFKNVMAWELFNEINWTDNAIAIEDSVVQWHKEMATYIRSKDIYQHLITTSTASETYGEDIWRSDEIDITQSHIYANSSNIGSALASTIKQRVVDYDKPVLMGEFGLGDNANLSNSDPNGIHIHNAMWATFFSGSMGTAMSWWWDNYIEPRNLYYHFKPFDKLVKAVNFVEGNYSAKEIKILNAPGDIDIIPSKGWGEIGNTMPITVMNEMLIVSPNLSEYLYGSMWNVQYRSPPNFDVQITTQSTFTVKTGANSGANPILTITVNGQVKLQMIANINESYSIELAPGKYEIKVDNTGTDWIQIASYTFSDIGTGIDAYHLTSFDNKIGITYLGHKKYQHTESLQHEAFAESFIEYEVKPNGNYTVEWYDCLTFELISRQFYTSATDKLSVPIPTLFWDAVAICKETTITSNEDLIQPLECTIFPNPSLSGQKVFIQLNRKMQVDVQVKLYSSEGSLISTLALNHEGSSQFSVLLPSLVDGLYFLQIQFQNQSKTIPIYIK